MTKKDVFADIVSLMTTDYAGLNDNIIDSEPFKKRISAEMSAQEFQFLVEDYLRSFRDGHVALTTENNQLPALGFTVRRYQDSLIVTKVNGELALGDEVVLIDDKSVADLGKEYKLQLDQVLNRQNWVPFLKRAQEITVKSSVTGDLKIIKLKRYKNSYEPEHLIKNITDKIGLMKLTDFLNPDDVSDLLVANTIALNKLDYLIVDVRTNLGGTDSAYWPLLNYFVDEPDDLMNHYPKYFGYERHWTERNKRNWLATLTKLAKNYESADFNEILVSETHAWETAKMAEKEVSDDEASIMLEPKGNLKHVYVLSDYWAGSAGDTFIMLAKTFNKVTVLGRNTMGIVDYGNVTSQKYPDFEVHYPTTRLTLVDDGKGTNGIGFSPDIELPWTPQSVHADLDLQAVLMLIDNKTG